MLGGEQRSHALDKGKSHRGCDSMLHQVLDPCSGKQGGPSDSIHGPLAISLCFWAEIPMKKGEIGMQTGQHTVGGKMTSVLGLGGGLLFGEGVF